MVEPLVLASGIAGDEETWRDAIAALGDAASCHALVPQGATIDAMADDVLARAPGRFALAGHSMGGYVALAVQRRGPDRVMRIALINSSAAPDTDEQRAARRKTIAAVERFGYPAVADGLTAAILARADGDLPARFAAMLLRAGGERFVREQRAAMDRPDARPALAAIAVPALVVGGTADRIIDPARSREIADHLPGATLAMLDTGHAAPMEAPDRLAALMRDWLAA